MRIDTSKNMIGAKTLNSLDIEKSDEFSPFVKESIEYAKSKVLSAAITPADMITYDDKGVNSLFRLATSGYTLRKFGEYLVFFISNL